MMPHVGIVYCVENTRIITTVNSAGLLVDIFPIDFNFKRNSKSKPTMTAGREYTTICLKQFEMILICNMRTCTCNMRTCLSLKLAETLTKLFFKSFDDELYRYNDND